MGGGPRRLRGRGGRDRLGRGRGLGRPRVPRLLRGGRAAHGAAARRRLAPPRRPPPRRAGRRSSTWASPSASRSRCRCTAPSRRTGSRTRRTTSPSCPRGCSRSSRTSLGTLAVVVVALRSFRRRPLGNALIIAGIAAAAIGSGLAGLGAAGQRDRDRGRRGAALRRIRRIPRAFRRVFQARNGQSLSHKRCLNKIQTCASLPSLDTDRISRAERCSPSRASSRPLGLRLASDTRRCTICGALSSPAGCLLAFAGMATAAAAAGSATSEASTSPDDHGHDGRTTAAGSARAESCATSTRGGTSAARARTRGTG